jgi:hypothetical protein
MAGGRPVRPQRRQRVEESSQRISRGVMGALRGKTPCIGGHDDASGHGAFAPGVHVRRRDPGCRVRADGDHERPADGLRARGGGA